MTHSQTICPALCSQAEFARLIGVSPRRASQLAIEGVLVFDGKQVLAQDSLSRYLARLRESAETRIGKSGGVDLTAERARHTMVQRQLAQRHLDRELAEVITREDAAAGWAHICGRTRQFLDDLPGQIAARLPHLTAHDRRVAERVVADAQRMLAEELRDGAVPGSIGPEDLLPKKERK